jgi:hypothetical protein
MPLITSTTRFNKLKWDTYGNDRFDSGKSNQPYITKRIPGVEYNNPSQTFADQENVGLSTDSVDFLLRGGLGVVDAVANDVSRLTQMLFDTRSPNGFEFIAKQNVLSRNNVKTEASFGAGYAGGGLNQGLYTPVGTLLQAAVDPVATGITNLFGINPLTDNTPLTTDFKSSNNGGVNSYFATVNMQNTSDDIENSNRLVNLNTAVNTNTPSVTVGGNIILNPGGQAQASILQYGGGPGSILGIGNTNILFADQRTGRQNAKVQTSGFLSTSNPEIPSSGNYSIYKRPVPSVLVKDANYRGVSDVWNNSIFNLAFSDYGGFEPLARAYDGLANISPYIYGSMDEDFTFPDGGASGRAAAMNAGFINPEGPNDYSVFTKPTTTFGNNLNIFQISKGNLFISGSGVTGIFGNLFPESVSQLTDELTIELGNNNYSDQFSSAIQGWNNSVYSTKVGDDALTSWESKTTENGTATFTQAQLYSDRVIGSRKGLKNPKDFRKVVQIEGKTIKTGITQSSVLSLSPDYVDQNIDVRLNLGNPGGNAGILNNSSTNGGREVKDVLHYGIDAKTLQAIDTLNALPMYEGEAVDSTKSVNDSIKFRIAIINNDAANGTATYLHFRAFIDSFNDNYTAKWDSVNYAGRGEELYNYQGFGREVSMSWTVYAQSKAELIPMYKKLNYLASSLAPDYNSAGFMRGNIVRLTMGGYLYEQPGIIKSLSFGVPEESPWEIGINEQGGIDQSVKELPHMIKVTGFTFIPIQKFIPSKADSLTDPTQKYISLANNNKTTNYSDPYKSYAQGGGVIQ